MSQIKKSGFLAVILAAAISMVVACSSSNSHVTINPDSGKHGDDWANPNVHGAVVKGTADSSSGFNTCQACHGSNFSGGTSGVSCFSCHGVAAPHPPGPWRGDPYTHTNTNPSNAPLCALCHTNGANSNRKPSEPAPAGTSPGCFNNTLCHGLRPGHPGDWANPDLHGVSAKSAPGELTGFSSCQVCHGSEFTGGDVQVTCLNTCHGVSAPHPAKPWRAPLTARTHTTTDPLNAPACGFCHTNGANSSVKPVTPAPTGTFPGCFNNTLCHGSQPVHPAGWPNPDQHGASAKAAPDGMSGFSICQLCHGSDFSGGGVQVTCLKTCHGGAAPHPAKPWRAPLTLRTHTTTDPKNGIVCGICHKNGANSSEKPSSPAPSGTPSGCFNSSLCHGPRPFHSAGWDNPGAHGAAAKSAPGNVKGFASCQACHGTGFGGGSVQVTCLRSCHGVPSPHPGQWLGPGFTHKTTDSQNAPVCAPCHANGANSPIPPPPPQPQGTRPDCFNGTLCHKF